MAKSDLARRLQTRQTELDVVLQELGRLIHVGKMATFGNGMFGIECLSSRAWFRDGSVKFRNLTIDYPVHSFFARSKISSTVCPS